MATPDNLEVWTDGDQWIICRAGDVYSAFKEEWGDDPVEEHKINHQVTLGLWRRETGWIDVYEAEIPKGVPKDAVRRLKRSEPERDFHGFLYCICLKAEQWCAIKGIGFLSNRF